MRISDWSSDVCSSDLTENSKLSAKLTQPLEDIETSAIAIAMNRLRHCRPPVRWPARPVARLSARDGTVPIPWDAPYQYPESGAVSLGSIPLLPLHNDFFLASCWENLFMFFYSLFFVCSFIKKFFFFQQ